MTGNVRLGQVMSL